ncbi:MAG: hypothetical protein HYW81_01530 [Parcubacteria group bacterium]|nr:hypothetical protein [Parcubacteria group bacterium]
MLAWHVVLSVALFGLLVAYVWQMNNQAQHAFSIREFGEKRAELEDEVRDLHWQLSSARSLAQVAQRAEHLAFEAPREVTYLQMGFSTVAAYGSPVSP